jgi:hypothetical protein
MILTKSCPRCQGDMMEEELLGDVEMVCLQCGHRAYGESQPLKLAAPQRIVKKAA